MLVRKMAPKFVGVDALPRCVGVGGVVAAAAAAEEWRVRGEE